MSLRTLGLLTIALVVVLLVVKFQSESEMVKPPKSKVPEEAAGEAADGAEVTPTPGETPEQGDSTGQEQGIGMPGTPEELRRLKEEADKPDSDKNDDSKND